ncbi:hypothetical protein CONPUDRAFT_159074 [Coniophora puteana RWD-64-598 SS2]|uniref:Uncharacterized protein n=1 Tax=Coniophora puteana (strain RWD-64-598) TaxID=741705 RepID=A0A5M3M9K9_CONPW|nr:uncharacterized protein CONPUDRAFT_159074 [Coniophora puteana RWD-64-598 SS2]EIW75626.1 hypothetical protein CONPUDRAFT_159074 [Coniophora puteana RWD-64-598 SS2]
MSTRTPSPSPSRNVVPPSPGRTSLQRAIRAHGIHQLYRKRLAEAKRLNPNGVLSLLPSTFDMLQKHSMSEEEYSDFVLLLAGKQLRTGGHLVPSSPASLAFVWENTRWAPLRHHAPISILFHVPAMGHYFVSQHLLPFVRSTSDAAPSSCILGVRIAFHEGTNSIGTIFCKPPFRRLYEETLQLTITGYTRTRRIAAGSVVTINPHFLDLHGTDAYPQLDNIVKLLQ